MLQLHRAFLAVSAAILMLNTVAMQAYGQEPDILHSDVQKKYEIGIYLLNVGKVDLQTGSYDLDFYMWIKSNEADFTQSKPKFEFMNGRVTTEVLTVEPNYYEVRVKGNFLKNMNFQKYPFEQLFLTVEVEGIDDIDKMVFVPDADATGIDKLVNIPGWRLVSSDSTITEHQYPDEKSYSRYIFSITIERFFLSSFLKTIFPVLIITTIAMLAFWMSPTNFTSRIGLGASTLLAAVAAHLNAANQLPPIGYLTLFDKIMIIAYALFLNNLLSMVIQMRLIDHDQKEDAVRVNARMRKLMPVIIIAIFFALLLV
ncbi:MAG: hypothetical protein QXE84_04890 [Candidatus Nitrosotenuis sp.]|uniref:Neurotransmitter-gated ion-channel ligand-binding domain-containing protein n=1 Tax=Candidatus Nitrosotenuis uzonensis TaxID=1407055 RepID=A0A812EZ69_9ARCH|nr:hypothetical protein [Candidatus Nitrosotenuis uzonensis]CAE6487840.1 conserved membrane hypothetical protein [Candidatus Nitrosotenuis uzonensis]